MRAVLSVLFALILCFFSNPNASGQAFSLDGDTAYCNGKTILRSGHHITPIINSTPHENNRICNWGDEIRLTYTNNDSVQWVSSPRACLNDDTVITSYIYHLGSGPRAYGQNIISSIDRGNFWSSPYDFHNPGSIQTYILDINYYSGYLYAAGVDCRDITNRSGPFFRRSDQFPFNWDPPVRFLRHDALFMGDVQVRAYGDTLFYLYFLSIGPLNNSVDSFYICRSFNEGVTWEEPRAIAYCRSATDAGSFLEAPAGILNIITSGYSRGYTKEIYQYISMDYGVSWESRIVSDDDSIHSQLPSLSRDSWGKLLVSWMDYKYGDGGGGFAGDILCRVSSDDGMSWGQVLRATTQPTAAESASLIEGAYLGVVWLDVRDGWIRSQLYFAESVDSGNLWSDELRLTYSIKNTESPILAYDYPNAMLFWQDARDHDYYQYEIYARGFEIDESGIDESDSENSHLEPIICYPNPFNSATTITLTGAEQVEIGIYDITGRLIAMLHTSGGQAQWDASGYSSGLYFARAAGEKGATIKLVLVK